MPRPKYVTFSGGGAKGATYPGAYKALKDSNIFDDIESVAGSSAGAITAAFASSGMTASQLKSVSDTTNFKSLLGSKSHWYGLERTGDPLYQFVSRQLKKNILDFFDQNPYQEKDDERDDYISNLLARCLDSRSGITFSDISILHSLYPQTFKELTVTAVEQRTGDFQVFNSKYTPDIDIATAVRASASIPVLLRPVEINGRRYIDGGYFDNLPTDDFGSPEIESEIRSQTLVFAFGEGRDERHNPVHNALHTDNEVLYRPGKLERLKRNTAPSKLGNVRSAYQNTDRKEAGYKKLQAHYKGNTVELKVGDIKTTDFNKAQNKGRELFYEGYFSTKDHLISKGFEESTGQYKLQKFFFENFKETQQHESTLSRFKVDINKSRKYKQMLSFCDLA